jgi:tetratricopeptide (TPR) repeat protein
MIRQRFQCSALLAVVLLCLPTCSGGPTDLHEDTTLTDEKANPYAFNRSIAMMFLRTQQPAEALRVVRRLIDLDSDSAEPFYLLGRAHVDLRQFTLAERSLREALRRKPDYAEAHSMYGVLLDMLERHQEARLSHKRALKYAPEKAEYHNNLGFHYFLSKQYAHAAKSYEAALQRDPGSHRTHNNLGFTYGKLGRLDQALRHFQFAGPPAQATNNLGVVLEGLGDLERAFEAFVAACRIDPRLVPSRANLARVAERLGRELPELPSPREPERSPEDPAAAAAVSMSAPTPTEPASTELNP